MTLLDLESSTKPFVPGTTGWTAADLDDPDVERQWFAGRYEIIQGVLTMMAPAYFSGGEALENLVLLVHDHLKKSGLRGGFAPEVDVVIDQTRVIRADTVYLSPEAKQRQRAAAKAEGHKDLRRTRILVPPTLIIESISPGHEAHDRVTKMRWYAEFRVPNYWLLDIFAQTLECLILEEDHYRQDVSGHGMEDVLRPAAFPGLQLPLKEVWGD